MRDDIANIDIKTHWPCQCQDFKPWYQPKLSQTKIACQFWIGPQWNRD